MDFSVLSGIRAQIDDVADLTRLCRTSRLFHYMAPPALYRTITLNARNETVRENEDITSDGHWYGSVFAMGLNTLVTRKTANTVESLVFTEGWREYNLADYARARRIPDGSVMLNIVA